MTVPNEPASEPPLDARIRRLYDDTTEGWVEVWGEHLHHGHYGPHGQLRKDHLQAQVDMVDEVLTWGGLPLDGEVKRVLDAGCGVGGSARHLASKLGARVDGLTLSPVQRDIAKRLSKGRSDVHFHVADATRTDFKDGAFDLVWSLESGEHMPSKRDFVAECARVLRPGGRLIIATWCHRRLPPPMSARAERLLEGISEAYGRSLTWVPLTQYEEILKDLPLDAVRTEDWSDAVKPFWNAVLLSALSPKGLKALWQGGRSMVTGAYGGLKMRAGLRNGLVRYVVISAIKRGSRR